MLDEYERQASYPNIIHMAKSESQCLKVTWPRYRAMVVSGCSRLKRMMPHLKCSQNNLLFAKKRLFFFCRVLKIGESVVDPIKSLLKRKFALFIIPFFLTFN